MKPGRLEPYEHSLRTREPLELLDNLGRVFPLDTVRWLRAADADDHTVLDRCHGPVLDLGCGPGRIVAALAGRAIPALGVDVAPAAVRLTRDLGAPALERDLFGPLPGEGRWPTVLLLDGNLGIGGDVARLLSRVAKLLAPRGRAIAEVEPESCDEVLTVRFRRYGVPVGGEFTWARLGSAALQPRAIGAGLLAIHEWRSGSRHFVELMRA